MVVAFRLVAGSVLLIDFVQVSTCLVVRQTSPGIATKKATTPFEDFPSEGTDGRGSGQNFVNF
jgi:hypothetical protein